MVTSLSPKRILPLVGFSRPQIMFSVVLFPQPDGPRRPMSSPSGISKLKSFTAVTRLLFLPRAQEQGWSAMQSMKHLQALVRPTLMEIYQITELEADLYFRDLWFVVHSLSTLIVTGDCPYSDQEIGQVLTGVSISICKSIKEIAGFAAGTFDRDAAFRALVGKGRRVQEDD